MLRNCVSTPFSTRKNNIWMRAMRQHWGVAASKNGRYHDFRIEQTVLLIWFWGLGRFLCLGFFSVCVLCLFLIYTASFLSHLSIPYLKNFYAPTYSRKWLKKTPNFYCCNREKWFWFVLGFFFLTKRKITSTNYALKHNDPLVWKLVLGTVVDNSNKKRISAGWFVS